MIPFHTQHISYLVMRIQDYIHHNDHFVFSDSNQSIRHLYIVHHRQCKIHPSSRYPDSMSEHHHSHFYIHKENRSCLYLAGCCLRDIHENQNQYMAKHHLFWKNTICHNQHTIQHLYHYGLSIHDRLDSSHDHHICLHHFGCSIHCCLSYTVHMSNLTQDHQYFLSGPIPSDNFSMLGMRIGLGDFGICRLSIQYRCSIGLYHHIFPHHIIHMLSR